MPFGDPAGYLPRRPTGRSSIFSQPAPMSPSVFPQPVAPPNRSAVYGAQNPPDLGGTRGDLVASAGFANPLPPQPVFPKAEPSRGVVADAFGGRGLLGAGAQAGRTGQLPPPSFPQPVGPPDRGTVHDTMQGRGVVGRAAQAGREADFWALMGVPKNFQGLRGNVPTRNLRSFGPFARG